MAEPSQQPQPQRLYLIDGYSNIFRAFYAIRNLSSSRGEPTNAVYGFIQMLRKLLRDEAPELVGVALDVSSETVRTEAYQDYKANRAPMPEDLRPQIPWIRKTLECYRIPILEMERYEADDVLGTLAKKASEAGYHVVLVSADKDLAQLVGPRVSLMHTGRNKVYTPELVAEDYGVPPERVVDVLALMGDTSDNVPGVPGIGQKGAQQLIQEYGTVENLLEHAGEISRKSYREGLEQHRDQALLSKELVTIHTDLPVEFDPDDLRHDPPDADALRKLFSELEFFSLLEEVERDAAGAEEIGAGEEVTAPEEWRERTAGLPGRVLVSCLGKAEPLGLVVGAAEKDGGGVYADFRRDGLRDAALEGLARWVADPGRELVGHDLKEVLRMAAAAAPGGERLAVRAGLFDVMLVSYLIRPAVHGHSFEEMCLERLARKALTDKDAGWSKEGAPPVGDSRLAELAGERVVLGRRLAEGAAAELEQAGDGALAKVYREIEEPLLPVLLAMEERGVLLDCDYLAAMSVELGTEVADLERRIYDVAGEEFNVASPQQLGVILFEKLGYPVLKRTQKTKSYATGAEILEELAARGYELPVLLLRYRELTKLKSTYVDALPALVAEDGRLHTRFNQAVAATGRLSSANPNLQNIPVRTELGQRIRRAFVAEEGSLLLAADYSQVELRILAHIAEEPALIEAFRRGEDIHRATAATVLGVAPELVTAEQRRAAKTINFGILYGMSAFGLAQALGIGRAEAEEFIRAYLARYEGVKRYREETLRQAQEEGKVETLYGRVRYLPDIASKNRMLRENAERMAINARIQGTAADIMKIAMVRLDRRLAAEHPGARLLLTVHDELVLEVPAAEVEAVAGVAREEME
ncbi:MAG TPA: DNA polymerase I, partial [Thermoanaerobaculia bacterium]|nr:DNA polymerase I [Thermoanaerobaculia bacterium]